MKARQFWLSVFGSVLVALQAFGTWNSYQLRQQADAIEAMAQIRGRLTAVELEGVARKAWQQEHDVTTRPLIAEHVAFFKAWPAWAAKTDLVYRYVLRHGQPNDFAPMADRCPCTCGPLEDPVPASFADTFSTWSPR